MRVVRSVNNEGVSGDRCVRCGGVRGVRCEGVSGDGVSSEGVSGDV